MGDIDAPEPVELAPPRDLMHEPFVSAMAGEREITAARGRRGSAARAPSCGDRG